MYSVFRLSLGFVVYSAVNVDKVRECHHYAICIKTVFRNNCRSKFL